MNRSDFSLELSKGFHRPSQSQVSKKINITYGGLNEYGSRRSTESGTIRKYGLAGVSVALLKEVFHW